MILFVEIFNMVILVGILAFMGFCYSNFEGYEIPLGAIATVVAIISSFICKKYDDLNKEYMLKEETVIEKDKQIDGLKNKITQLIIPINGGSPYNIQEYIINASDNNLVKGRKYCFEIIASTIDENYDLTYINIAFNKRINLEGERNFRREQQYKLQRNHPIFRNGMYEYSFLLKNIDKVKFAKCKFEIVFGNIEQIEMSIEVVGKEKNINKKKIIDLNIVS